MVRTPSHRGPLPRAAPTPAAAAGPGSSTPEGAAEPAPDALAVADPEAFGHFFALYFPRVHAWCLRRIGDPPKTERATEAILEDAVRGLATGPGAPSLAIQVFRATRRGLEGRPTG